MKRGDNMQLLTLAEVARRLGVCDKTARKVVQQLPTVRVGKRVRYRSDVLENFVERGGLTIQRSAA
jgi:excisionase family DNA binding protein